MLYTSDKSWTGRTSRTTACASRASATEIMLSPSFPSFRIHSQPVNWTWRAQSASSSTPETSMIWENGRSKLAGHRVLEGSR